MEIYIHLPFCKAKCKYCDFNSYAGADDATMFSYLAALRREIGFAGEQFGKAEIETVYIGGGTPSMLDAAKISGIVSALDKAFDLSKMKEFTIECNPESLTEEKLIAYRQAGINRISLGVQSLSDRNLKNIGRLHDAKSAIDKALMAAEHFDNVSCDVIIGLPYDSEKSVIDELDVLAPIVKHISVYQLTLEKNTPLYERVSEGLTILPDDDEVADMQVAAIDTLRRNGFERYEVSNFARKGYESKHNMGYWTGEEYLGIGAGAHSFIKTEDGAKQLANAIRFASPKDINAYIAGINCSDAFMNVPRMEMNVLTADDLRYERVMLGLRTKRGVERELIDGKITDDIRKFFVSDGNMLSLSDEGMAVMNSLLIRILP